MRNTTHPQPATTTRLPASLCQHTPRCPSADSPDREAARIVAAHREQGWSLLCNSLLLWEDTGALLPDGQIVTPHRPTDTVVGGALVLRGADASGFAVGPMGCGKSDKAALDAAMAARSSSARPV